MKPDEAPKIDLSVPYFTPSPEQRISISEFDKPRDPRTAEVEAIEHKNKFVKKKVSILVQKKPEDKIKIKNRTEHKQTKTTSTAADLNKSETKKRPCIAESFSLLGSKDIEEGMQSWRSKVSAKANMRRDKGMITKAKTLGMRYWFAYFFWVIIALVIQFMVGAGEWAFPQGAGGNTNSACSPLTLGSQVMRNKNVCNLNVSLAEGSARLTFLSAFIVGGFLLNSVKLWRERRTAYCALCGATRNLLINLCTVVDSQALKKVLTRWAIMGFELAVLKGRGLIDLEDGRAYLEGLRLLKLNEWEKLVDGDRHTTVWYWIQAKAAKLSKDGVIDSVGFQTICQAVTLSRDKANDLMSCIDRDQPPPYVFVCAFLININLYLHSAATGLKWAIWMYDSDGLSIWLEPRMYAEVLILFLYTMIYAMLFDVCTILYNPFGPRDIDIEHFQVGRGIRNLAKQLQNIDHPDTMEDLNDNDFADDFSDDGQRGGDFQMALLSKSLVHQQNVGLLRMSVATSKYH